MVRPRIEGIFAHRNVVLAERFGVAVAPSAGALAAQSPE